MTSIVAVIPDIQGIPERIDSALAKCDELGVTDIIQLGDAADCRERQAEGDLYTLKLLLERDATLLLGNHEVSVVSPRIVEPFMGANRNTEASKLVADLFTDGRYLAATHVGNTLITHAGVLEGPWTISGELPSDESAQHFAQMLNKFLDDAEPGFVHPLLANIPIIRGGWDSIGGIFWADFGEHVRQLRMNQSGFNGLQLIGHTPQANSVFGQTIAVLDSRNEEGVTMAVTRDDGETWEYVITNA